MKILPIIVAAALGMGTSSAQADLVDDKPAAASPAPGNAIVAARDNSGNTLTRFYRNNAWSEWVSLGGFASSGPAVGERQNGVTDYFVRGGDNALYHKYVNSAGQSDWWRIEANLTSAPAVSYRKGTDYIDVFARGASGDIVFKYWGPSTQWSPGWASLGGGFKSAPATISHETGKIDVFGRGLNDEIYQKHWNGSSWSDWMSLGGQANSAPTVESQTPGTVDVFYTGYDQNVYQKSWNGSSWSSWNRLDTIATSAPAAIAEGNGRVMLFTRGGDTIYYNQFLSGSWTGWKNWGEVAEPGIATDAEFYDDGTGNVGHSSQPPTCRNASKRQEFKQYIKWAPDLKVGTGTFRTQLCWDEAKHTASANKALSTVETSISTKAKTLGWNLDDYPNLTSTWHASLNGYPKGWVYSQHAVRLEYCVPLKPLCARRLDFLFSLGGTYYGGGGDFSRFID